MTDNLAPNSNHIFNIFWLDHQTDLLDDELREDHIIFQRLVSMLNQNTKTMCENETTFSEHVWPDMIELMRSNARFEEQFVRLSYDLQQLECLVVDLERRIAQEFQHQCGTNQRPDERYAMYSNMLALAVGIQNTLASFEEEYRSYSEDYSKCDRINKIINEHLNVLCNLEKHLAKLDDRINKNDERINRACCQKCRN